MLLNLALLLASYIILTYLFNLLWLKPRRLRSRLSSQGISGPTPSFLLGNLVEIKGSLSTTFSRKSMVEDGQVTHEWANSFFPFLNNWAKQYGSNFMFWVGTLPVLYLGEYNLVKEICLCTSSDLGKSAFLQKFFGPLLGQGLLTSNGLSWVYQRKIIAPELHLDKIKGKFSLIVESATSLANSWESQLSEGSESVDIRIDEDLRCCFADVISKACFGSTYSDAKEIFVRIRALHQAMPKKSLLVGLPALKYLPTKSNREIWKLEKELRTLILKVVQERRRGAYQRDLLQIIIDGANNSDLSSESATNFIVDNCKNIYLSGQGITPMSACWTLLLLAAHPDWQARVRDEILEVSGGHPHNLDIMLPKMKLLGMVIIEAMRLYPAFAFLSREALKDIKLGSIQVPKGTNIWFPILALHRDRFLWGPDADEFRPERFAKGVAGACKFPQLYMPFGAGSYVCVGQHLAMTELKIVTSLLLSKFSFSISPKYQHAPVFRLNIEPEVGVNLLVKRI